MKNEYFKKLKLRREQVVTLGYLSRNGNYKMFEKYATYEGKARNNLVFTLPDLEGALSIHPTKILFIKPRKDDPTSSLSRESNNSGR